MKKFVIFGAVALAACSQAEEAAPEAAATEEAAVEEVAAVAADGGPAWGTFEVTKADGTVHTFIGNEDGTYVVNDAAGTQISAGTWRQDGPNRFCETEEGGEEECNTETVDANGVYTSVSETDPTDSSTIVRIN